MRNLLYIFISLLFFTSCDKGEKLDNQAPDTKIVFESINLSGDDRLNSRVRLSWFGTDIDGYVVGYEMSLDNTNWSYITTQDSTFVFPLEQGKDTTDIDFYIRAIDDQGAKDPTPSYLRVPLKNSPPSAQFVASTLPLDSNHLAVTFSWSADDADGFETITNAYLKCNSGNWTEIPLNATILSMVSSNPTASGSTTASLFYNNIETPISLPGFNADGDNVLYLKVQDFAGAESAEDTSNTFFVSNKKNNLLFITGQDKATTDKYKTLLTNKSFDFIDYGLADLQPKFWDQTFPLIIESYDGLFINSDANVFTNPFNQQSALLLDFMAPSLQQYFNENGKAFVTTSFTTTSDITAISEVFPVDSISTSNGQARLDQDSGIVAINQPTWPNVYPQFLLAGVSPFHPTQDATPIYKGQLKIGGGWVGPNVVGARRGNTQIFFSVQLHQLDKDPSAQQQLMETMLNELGL